MSDSAALSSSLSASTSSISLLEVKAETKLVLQAFLHRTLSTPLKERPGRVGGAYKDHNKYRSKSHPKVKDGGDSQAEDVSSADEKKTGFRDLIKQLPRRTIGRRPAEKDDALSPSTSEDDESDRKQHKKLSQKKIKRKLSEFFRIRLDKEKNKKAHESGPKRPVSPASPSHQPEFYEEVAEKLEKIAQRSTSIKAPKVSPILPVPEAPVVYDKEAVVQKLVKVLSSAGDSMDVKIQSDPFLRKNISRLSYASFTKVIEAFSQVELCEAATMPPPASPTLQRMAISMEVSRRMVTATGAVHMENYATRYMETFIPWVKRQGGWENVVDLEEHSEYD